MAGVLLVAKAGRAWHTGQQSMQTESNRRSQGARVQQRRYASVLLVERITYYFENHPHARCRRPLSDPVTEETNTRKPANTPKTEYRSLHQILRGAGTICGPESPASIHRSTCWKKSEMEGMRSAVVWACRQRSMPNFNFQRPLPARHT